MTGRSAPGGETRLGGLAGGVLAVVLWGVSFAVTRAAVREIPPLFLALLRFVLASLVLWPVVHLREGPLRVAPGERRAVLALGLSGVSLYFGFENVGLVFTTAGHGALIVATIPLATAVIEALRKGYRLGTRTAGGLGVALAGVWLVVGEPEGSAHVLGDVLMLGAVTTWVWYTFLVERLAARRSRLALTQLTMVSGALTLAPLAAVETLVRPPVWPSPSGWAAVAYLGLLCSALAYWLWNRAVTVLGPTASSSLIYGVPLVGVGAGVLFLGEPFTAVTAAGAALILGGVAAAASAPPAAGGRTGR